MYFSLAKYKPDIFHGQLTSLVLYKRNVQSVSRFRFTRIVSKCKESVLSTKPIFKVAFHNIFFIHDIFHLDTRAAERIRGCAIIVIFVAVYYKAYFSRSSITRPCIMSNSRRSFSNLIWTLFWTSMDAAEEDAIESRCTRERDSTFSVVKPNTQPKIHKISICNINIQVLGLFMWFRGSLKSSFIRNMFIIENLPCTCSKSRMKSIIFELPENHMKKAL